MLPWALLRSEHGIPGGIDGGATAITKPLHDRKDLTVRNETIECIVFHFLLRKEQVMRSKAYCVT